MTFIVEVPAYVRVSLRAPDADTAAAAAAKVVDGLTIHASLDRVAGSWQCISPEIVPLDEDDQPDVYVCSGGKLAQVEADGFLSTTEEDCE